MYEDAVCGPHSMQPPVNKWNLSTKKKVRLYFITEILFLYPGIFIGFAADTVDQRNTLFHFFLMKAEELSVN